MANNKIIRKVIIDTDPGIDDAMALMMALQAHDRGKQRRVVHTMTYFEVFCKSISSCINLLFLKSEIVYFKNFLERLELHVCFCIILHLFFKT